MAVCWLCLDQTWCSYKRRYGCGRKVITIIVRLNSEEVAMPPEEGVRKAREAVGVFSSPETLQEAIDELLSSGFHRAELSLLASEHAVEEKLRYQYEKVNALADD